jgi:hypothetical protein
MVPAYFQVSRWLRAYLQKPAYVDGYKPATAQGYVYALLGKLTGPNPAAEPIKKLGVSGVPFRNLDYISKDWIGGKDLLESSCGFPGEHGDQAGQYNGRADYAILRAGFHELFARDNDFDRAKTFPLFSIIDTNSAHHVSAPLVERAVRFADAGRIEGRPERAMIVINFDAHTDYGASSSVSPITCQSWGRFVSNTMNGIYQYPLADAYVRFGKVLATEATATWSHGEWHKSDANSLLEGIDYDRQSGDALGAQLDAVCTAVAKATGKDGVDAYVSLDRDLLQRSFSQYSDGPFPPDAGINGVKHCLSHLAGKQVRIVGFDVTGLPTYPGSVRPSAKAQGEFTVANAIELADQQIVELWRHAATVGT